jgi:hypothetical protein
VSEPWWAKPGGAPAPGQPVPQAYSGAPPAVPPTAPRKQGRSRGPILLWVGLACVVVVVAGAVLVAVLWRGGSMRGTELDVASAQAGVAEILSDPVNGYGANDVADVVCNNGDNPVIEAGRGFRCEVRVNGQQREVEVVFRDDSGTYAVDGPR